jgi:hypothetical protein
MECDRLMQIKGTESDLLRTRFDGCSVIVRCLYTEATSNNLRSTIEHGSWRDRTEQMDMREKDDTTKNTNM